MERENVEGEGEEEVERECRGIEEAGHEHIERGGGEESQRSFAPFGADG
jgi:hypothetical protein